MLKLIEYITRGRCLSNVAKSVKTKLIKQMADNFRYIDDNYDKDAIELH